VSSPPRAYGCSVVTEGEVPVRFRPDARVEAGIGGAGDVARLALAESPHSLSYPQILDGMRERLPVRSYKRNERDLQTALRLEYEQGGLDRLAFRANRWRLTPDGLARLEADKEAYAAKVAEATRELAAAAEALPDRRPGVNHARIEVDGSFEAGLAASWINTRLGLIQYDGTDLLQSELGLLPDGHKGEGRLYLVVRRLELFLATDGHAEEILVFNYPKGDPEHGRRVFEGQETPDVHAEVRRERVPLGVLRQLAGELRGE
jgi:hypothetical protein